jgi:hypothetical protein
MEVDRKTYPFVIVETHESRNGMKNERQGKRNEESS